jgi:hypothetical protein
MILICALLAISSCVSAIKLTVSCPSSSVAVNKEFVASVSKFGPRIDDVLECGVQSKLGFMKNRAVEYENCIANLELARYWESKVSHLDINGMRSDIYMKYVFEGIIESFCSSVKRTHNITDATTNQGSIYADTVDIQIKSIASSKAFSTSGTAIGSIIFVILALVAGAIALGYFLLKKRKCCECQKNSEANVNEIISTSADPVFLSEKPPSYN